MSEGRSKSGRGRVVAADPLHREYDLMRLDGLIFEIEKAEIEKAEIEKGGGPFRDRDLLLEHLRSARQYLLGAMAVEYAMDLESAALTALGIGGERLRRHVTKEIRALRDEVRRAGPLKNTSRQAACRNNKWRPHD